MKQQCRKLKTNVVSFLDILGYKEIMRDESRVNSLFDAVSSIVEKAKLYINEFTDMDGENGKKFGNGETIINTLKYRAFSDNIVISCELYPQSDDKFQNWVNAVAIATVAMVQADIQIELLINHGLLSRGGMTIGDYYIDSEFVFGQGLVDAFRLEQNAEYPRIVVDDEVVRIFHQSSKRAGYNVEKDGSGGLFKRDYDEEYFVNPDLDSSFYTRATMYANSRETRTHLVSEALKSNARTNRKEEECRPA